MRFYHINTNSLEIISGDFNLQSPYIKNLLNTGNPELIPNLESYGIVPVEFATLLPNQMYDPTPVVLQNKVIFNAIPIPNEEE